MNAITRPDATQHVAGAARLVCSHCGSDDVRKVSLMYEQATSNLNFRAVSMNDQGGAAYTAGSGGIQNLMGGRIAPPVAPSEPKAPAKPFISVTVVSIVLTVWLFWVIVSPAKFLGAFTHPTGDNVVMFLFYFIFPATRIALYLIRKPDYIASLSLFQGRLRPEYESGYRRWTRSWMCMRCGDLFERS